MKLICGRIQNFCINSKELEALFRKTSTNCGYVPCSSRQVSILRLQSLYGDLALPTTCPDKQKRSYFFIAHDDTFLINTTGEGQAVKKRLA